MNESRLRVGFVGLGIMGEPMARNVLKAGFGLTVHNRTASKAEPLGEAGAAVASSPAQVASASDVIVTCVTADADVREVVLDAERGLIAGIGEAATVVDCSTVSPAVAVECNERLGAKGAGFVDAPISGGDVGAKAGTLSIMCGGDRAHFDRALPVLEAMGRTVTYCGGPGAGYLVKLCNQICGAVNLLAAAEAVSLAEAAGIDIDAMLQAVSSGAAGSWLLTNLAPKMVRGDDKPGFFVDYQLKDLRLAADAAHELGVPLPTTALAEAIFRAASVQGHGLDGTQSVIHVLRGLKGR